MTTSYHAITFGDPNPLKRWLQRRRLVSATQLAGRHAVRALSVCDFGAGNGQLCKQARLRFPSAQITCFEPSPSLMAEARHNLKADTKICFVESTESLGAAQFDIVFCLEVFEHLPPYERTEAFHVIQSILAPDGVVVIGVPVETGLPALYKGIFRMWRRFGAFDASPRHVLAAMLGRPPKHRPMGEITPGLRYHFEHMGFDHHRLRDELSQHFSIRQEAYSPFDGLGYSAMPEINFVASSL